jgi:hypothetical protein
MHRATGVSVVQLVPMQSVPLHCALAEVTTMQEAAPASDLLRVMESLCCCRKSSTFVGLILKDVKLPFPNHGHVILGDPAPILVYPISSTEARVLVDIPPTEKVPSAASGELRKYLMKRVHPQLPAELKEAFTTALESAQIRSMQNKQLAANPLHPPGALLLGDSFNMRHPLTGGGMTVALSDTKLLCDMLQPLPDFTDCIETARCTSEFYLQRKPLSSTINTLANALYEVFKQKNTAAHEEMRQACFDYLAQGVLLTQTCSGVTAHCTYSVTLCWQCNAGNVILVRRQEEVHAAFCSTLGRAQVERVVQGR